MAVPIMVLLAASPAGAAVTTVTAVSRPAQTSPPWSAKNPSTKYCHIGVSAGGISRSNWAQVDITHDRCSPGYLWLRIVAACQRHITGQAWNNVGKAEHTVGDAISAVCSGTFTAMRQYEVQWKVRIRHGSSHWVTIWRFHVLWKAS